MHDQRFDQLAQHTPGDAKITALAVLIRRPSCRRADEPGLVTRISILNLAFDRIHAGILSAGGISFAHLTNTARELLEFRIPAKESL